MNLPLSWARRHWPKDGVIMEQPPGRAAAHRNGSVGAVGECALKGPNLFSGLGTVQVGRNQPAMAPSGKRMARS
jgi:hypothetical protein